MFEMRNALSHLRKADESFFLIPPGSKILLPLEEKGHSRFLWEALKRYQRYSGKDFSLLPCHFLFSRSAQTMDGVANFEHFEVEDEELSRRCCGISPSPSALAKFHRKAYAFEAERNSCSLIALPTCLEEYLLQMKKSLLREGKASSYLPLSPAPGGRSDFLRPLLTLEEEAMRRGEEELGLPSFSLFPPLGMQKRERESLVKALFFQDPPTLPCARKRKTLRFDQNAYFLVSGGRWEAFSKQGERLCSLVLERMDAHRIRIHSLCFAEGASPRILLSSLLADLFSSAKPPLTVSIDLRNNPNLSLKGFEKAGDAMRFKIWKEGDCLLPE